MMIEFCLKAAAHAVNRATGFPWNPLSLYTRACYFIKNLFLLSQPHCGTHFFPHMTQYHTTCKLSNLCSILRCKKLPDKTFLIVNSECVSRAGWFKLIFLIRAEISHWIFGSGRKWSWQLYLLGCRNVFLVLFLSDVSSPNRLGTTVISRL